METNDLVIVTVESELLRIQNKLREWGFNSVSLTRTNPLCSWIEWGCDPDSGVQKMTDSQICDMASIIQEELEENERDMAELVDMGYEL